MPNISEVERDKSSPVWDMSQERAFIEQLMNQRINFFIAIFALVITGSANAKEQFFRNLILICGTIICSLFGLAIIRASNKLDKILKRLKRDETHPYTIIDKQAELFSVRWLLGYILPFFCVGVLVYLTYLSFFGCISVDLH